MAFAFANTLGDAPLEICWNAAQAAGALLGLDHEVLAGDVMTYLAGSLPKAFLDETAPCGETLARDCLCGGATQNSYQRLLATLPEPGAAAGGVVALVALASARVSRGCGRASAGASRASATQRVPSQRALRRPAREPSRRSARSR